MVKEQFLKFVETFFTAQHMLSFYEYFIKIIYFVVFGYSALYILVQIY